MSVVKILFRDISAGDIRQRAGQRQNNAGEILPSGVARMLDAIRPLDETDVFLDIGAGIGNVLAHEALSTDVSKCIGVKVRSELCSIATKHIHRFSVAYPLLQKIVIQAADVRDVLLSTQSPASAATNLQNSLLPVSSVQCHTHGLWFQHHAFVRDLDRQQELFQAARQKPGGSEATPVSQGSSINPKGYWPPEESFGADLFLSELKAPRGLIGGHTSKSAYERALVQKEPLFADNMEAARCVLLAQHQIPLKDFTTCRKNPRTGVISTLFGDTPGFYPRT
ncbi:hypothetical protein L917_05702, partial [Phytophthora nicotianae]